MEMKVETISTELIKPSLETPDHLRTVRLSFLDQIAPPNYFSLILVYESDDHYTTNKIHKLKQSLSETLNLFYPVAGRIEGSPFFSIDADDTGVEFTEARVANQLSALIGDSDPEELRKILPFVSGDVLLTAQATVFACGGIAVAVSMAHQIGDALSLMSFLNAWAATCRGDPQDPLPPTSFGTLASHFPVQDLSGYPFSSSIVISETAPVTKRLVFDKKKLAALKELASSGNNNVVIKDPTKVELISAFLWRFFIEAAKPNEKKPYAAVHAVSIRQRTDPPHTLENVFGNCFFSAFALIDKEKHHDPNNRVPELHELVVKLRETIRKVDHEYIKEAHTGEECYGNDLIKACTAIGQEEMEVCVFSSWCRFPVYEVDYGWGKPVCVSSPIMGMKNAVRMLTTKSGDGIEAIVNLLPENVGKLQQQFQLLGA